MGLGGDGVQHRPTQITLTSRHWLLLWMRASIQCRAPLSAERGNVFFEFHSSAAAGWNWPHTSYPVKLRFGSAGYNPASCHRVSLFIESIANMLHTRVHSAIGSKQARAAAVPKVVASTPAVKCVVQKHSKAVSGKARVLFLGV